MRARHVCAVLGIAAAVGVVTFMRSLVATNDLQATAVAERLLTEVPVEPAAEVATFALDYRPNGRVMQGPPMMACVATSSSPGRPLASGECLVTRAMFAARRLPAPPVGTELTLIGRNRTHHLKIAGFLPWERPLRGYPNAFVSSETAAEIDETWRPWTPRTVDELSAGFKSDAGRNMDRARPLLLWAAALTALCLLVNSLFLSVEARRHDLALLRTLGLTRFGVVRKVAGEALALTAVGVAAGVGAAAAGLAVFVACEPSTYPMGWIVSVPTLAAVACAAPVLSLVATLVALKPALSVKPLEAASRRLPRRRPVGMAVAFACGFGAFVAVEVWGASLMSAFVPSPEWPDAIVSILPGGVSSFDVAALREKVRGVARLHELLPLQVNFDPPEELPSRGGAAEGGAPGRGGRAKPCRNALLLGSDWLPEFRFVAGSRDAAVAALAEGDNCIVTAMMARARRLSLGDSIALDCGRGLKMSLKVVGIVDLNWHLVTSRGLVRGLNRMPVNTDGPVFVSFDTVEACDARPAAFVKMTHLWLDYEPAFLEEHGVFEAGRRVERDIADCLGLMTEEGEANTVRLHARDEIADGTLAHGDDLVGAMARVPFVFVLVLSIGFVAMLVSSVDARRREFVVLRAVGATRGQIARLLVAEALRVAGLGVAVGTAGGALVGWLCTSGTRAAMANWGIPANFVLPWWPLCRGAAGALLAALVVAVPTALALVRGRR